MSDALYYIASIKHTIRGHEHITFWAPDNDGYKLTFDEGMGKYSLESARLLNDGLDCLAIPVEAIEPLLSPEPYWRPEKPVRFYDTRGPVVDNSRANWKKLIDASLTQGRTHHPKPEVFRGRRRAFSITPVDAVVDHRLDSTGVVAQKLANMSHKANETHNQVGQPDNCQPLSPAGDAGAVQASDQSNSLKDHP